MNLARLLRPELIKLELETRNPPQDDPPIPRDRYVWSVKEAALYELAQLVAAGGRVGSLNKLYNDLLNREKKASTSAESRSRTCGPGRRASWSSHSPGPRPGSSSIAWTANPPTCSS
jgi:hypothetical protein